DAGLGVFERRAFGQSHDRVLARDVDGQAAKAHQSGGRGGIHDRTAPLFAHLANLVLHAEPYALDVDGHHAIEVALGGLVRVDDVALDAGVVVGAVQAPVSLDDPRDQRLHLGVVANVRHREFRLAPG